MKTTSHRWPLLYRFGNYLLAVVIAYLLASTLATQSVVSSLGSMGVDVSLADRLSMTLKDIVGVAPAFLPMIAAGFLAAFLVAWMICHWWPQWRTPLYIIAGASALITIHLTLKLAFGITPIAAGRTTGGLLIQGIAGAVGGWVYIRRL
jgi:hypothetical protein